MSSPSCYVQSIGNLANPLETVITGAGLTLVKAPSAAEAIVWTTNRAEGLAEVLADAPRARWVQLPTAGIERFLPLIRSHADGVVWTCAKPAYGPAVAEFAMGLLIAAFRHLDQYVVARSWRPLDGRLLSGTDVTLLGAGGIGQALTPLLIRFGATVTVVSRTGTPVDGARAVRRQEMMDVVSATEAVVVALPLTDETAGMVDRRFLSTMKETAWLVNVARGPIVVTDDLVDALRRRDIAGAALDVTDPEPLPNGHPLWELDNAIVTPHVANTPTLAAPALSHLIEDNARRFAAGSPLLGVVDPVAGY